MMFGIWEMLTLLSKVLFYLGLASSIGGFFTLALLARHKGPIEHIVNYIRGGALLGLLATSLGFFIQVGAFSDSGMAGMFDTMFMEVLWQSSVGDVTGVRLLGFSLLMVGTYDISRFAHKLSFNLYALGHAGVVLSGTLLLIYSFSLTGHLADAGTVEKVTIGLHGLTMCLWLGSLYPLWFISCGEDVQAIHKSMTIFGDVMAVSVSALLLCGLYLAYTLVSSWFALFTTLYGQVLLGKLLIVVLLLSLAASNKWLWVPRLVEKGSPKRLSQMITIEMGLGIIILTISTFLTTLMGPEH